MLHTLANLGWTSNPRATAGAPGTPVVVSQLVTPRIGEANQILQVLAIRSGIASADREYSGGPCWRPATNTPRLPMRPWLEGSGRPPVELSQGAFLRSLDQVQPWRAAQIAPAASAASRLAPCESGWPNLRRLAWLRGHDRRRQSAILIPP